MKLNMSTAAGQLEPTTSYPAETPLSPTNMSYTSDKRGEVDRAGSPKPLPEINEADNSSGSSSTKPHFNTSYNESSGANSTLDLEQLSNYLRKSASAESGAGSSEMGDGDGNGNGNGLNRPNTAGRRSNTSPENLYSPRSSIVAANSSMETPMSTTSSVNSNDGVHSQLKDNYKGFHANHRGKSVVNVPPLTQPIKPRFKKKSGSLLGKLIYSSRRDSENPAGSSTDHHEDTAANNHRSSSLSIPVSSQNSTRSSSIGTTGTSLSFNPQRRSTSSSTGSSSSASHKHKFRIPSLSLDHHGGASQGGSVSSASGVGHNNDTLNLSSHHSRNSLQPSLGSGNSDSSSRSPGSVSEMTVPETVPEAPEKIGSTFDLDVNEMHGIVKSPVIGNNNSNELPNISAKSSNTRPSITDIMGDDDDTALGSGRTQSSTSLSSEANGGRKPLLPSHSSSAFAFDNAHSSVGKAAWKAPDSWDVKFDAKPMDPNAEANDLKDGEDDDDDGASHCSSESTFSYSSEEPTEIIDENKIQSHEHHHHHHHHHQHRHHNQSKAKEASNSISTTRTNLPVLYGSRHLSHIVQPGMIDTNANNVLHSFPVKGPNHIVRIFKQDNTFTTILCPLETTTAELLTIVQRKFFLESVANYQISVHIGNCVKVLESFEKPLKIQMGLLLLSGYSINDNLDKIGREDLSFVCKFVLEDIYLRNLTHEEETILSKDYVEVNISGLNLKNIPIIFHQHTYEIEKLNVADNPSIYIPLDFIQSCNNLTSIIFSRNGCSKFPMNFLEAKKLTQLDMQKNFLDELPSKFGNHLKNLTHLKLNSNQLSTLPKSFGKLKNLVSLNLSSNYFNSYPEAVSELINLADLDLSYNDLSVLPDSISKLQNLAKLNLCTNKLEKSLPEFFTNFKSLKRLDIRYNQISNIDVLGTLPSLEVAYASKNNISGFSDRMENLRLLHFDRNPITDLQFENLLPILTVLDLSKAKITSVPPEFIKKIPNIEKLVLDKNHLVTLPDELGDLPKLAFLSLYGNNLQVLPSTIGHLTSLQSLDLHSNNLQSLPNEIWNLKSLTVLNVSSNMLTNFPKPPLSVAKRISSSINFKSLISEATGGPVADSRRGSVTTSSSASTPRTPSDELDGADGYIQSGPGGVGLSSQSQSLADSLTVLTLADNRLNDECFESISFLVELKSLNLSYNFLLEIPEGAVGRMTKLAEIFLSGNELTSLPTDDLENMKSLRLLHLNNNKLVSLPAELSKIPNLQTLDVGSNQLKYNISNWPYDWNWQWNKALKYLNFSGNKRFEIKQSHIKNPETGEDFDSLLVLKNLKVLGLIDVTLTTSSVPDQNSEMRIRTTASELENIGYGVSDSMGMRDIVSSRDIFIQKFRGNENEVLIFSVDGKLGSTQMGHRISSVAKSVFVPNFTEELNKLKSTDTVQDAIRRAFLSMNKEINGYLSAQKNLSESAPSTAAPVATKFESLRSLDLRDDGFSGASVTVVYIKDKKLYTANIGDIEALLCRNNGDHVLLTNKHDPTNRSEFERIRASGGYVSGDGALDGELPISRGVGFFNYLPHTHSGPDVSEYEVSNSSGSGGINDMIIIGTKVLWDYITYELAVDILREEKDDPMRAAQKLRDYAICYGATDKINVMVITLGENQKSNQLNNLMRSKYSNNNNLYSNMLKDGSEMYNPTAKKRRDRNQQAGDSTLRRLEDEIDPPIGEIALVFTDIKNSTLLWDTYPVAMRSAIKIHNQIMRRQLRLVGGYEVKTEGDAFMVSFPSPSSALLWCFNVQQQLIVADWPTEILDTETCCEITDSNENMIYRGISVRMGIHWGSPVYELDVVTRRMDYFGPMVNRTSRVNAVADGGQIAVSSDFLDEIKGLNKIHQDIRAGKITLQEAYSGNVKVGEVIERELSQLDEIGCAFFEIGERKLKGLEIPELITLAYPEKLKVRYEIYVNNKRMLEEAEENGEEAVAGKHLVGGETGSRLVGSIPVECIYGLRSISLRLENIAIFLSEGLPPNDTFKDTSSSKISEAISFKEADMVGMLNHIVSRIENNVALVHLRQEMDKIKGGTGRISDCESGAVWDVISEMAAMLNELKKLQ
ncbi:adenylate cyclase [[Candida] railenensis]|uniref:Adenylate cyclase n=1 Tax=[Candida] railenensis TaxID=45579 RepID=A0A9P0QUX0_9ASCO|nr:adenylate cyclase [[Candida] railenensis]